jgi:hypothetical protein
VTKVSKRYAGHVLVCVVPVLVIVVIHSYIGLQVEDCRELSGLFPNAAGDTSSPRRDARMREVFDAVQWEEGTLDTTVPASQMKFSIIRSYDPKKIYHHPEISLVRGATPARRDVEYIDAEGERVPVHRAYYNPASTTALVAFILIYHSRPVDNPYLSQIRSAPLQFVRGSYPMTLFFVSAQAPASATREMETQMKKWLIDGWRRYKTSCRG